MGLFVNKKIRIVSLICSILFFLLVISYGIYERVQENRKEVISTETNNVENVEPTLIEKNSIELEHQKEIDSMLLTEVQSHQYTIKNPKVILNPYENSPLSAVVIFYTSEKQKVSVKIKGKTHNADIKFKFSKYTNEHIIPVYGLYADTKNEIIMTLENKSGSSQTKSIFIKTAPLIDDIKNVSISTYIGAPTKYQEGLNFSYAGKEHKEYKMACDINGDVRWYLKKTYGISTLYSQSDYFYLTSSERTNEGGCLIYRINPLGRIYAVYYGPYAQHHEIQLTDKNELLIAGEESGENKTVEDILYKIGLDDGQLTGLLDYKDILQRTRNVGKFYDYRDWLHMNAAVQDKDDVVISSNYQSAIVKNDWNGNIKWILSDPAGYLSKWKQYLLHPIGSNFEYPYNQHAIEILPDYDKNSDTVDILMFDNGSSRNFVDKELQRKIQNNEVNEPKLYSRLVHYRINEKDMTVEQIWQYGKERPELFSTYRGDADLLENGNILGCFNQGMDGDEAKANVVYVEIDRDGDVIWECYLEDKTATNQFQAYRVERVNIYNESANNLLKDLEESTAYYIPDNIK